MSEHPFKSWHLPELDDADTPKQPRTNALNKTPGWTFEPPEQQEQLDVQMPTAEEIEAIRQAAWEEGRKEGLAEGKAEGRKLGYDEGLQQGTEEGITQGTEQGLAAAKEQIEALHTQLSGLINNLQKPVASVDKRVEQELVKLAVSLARAVLRIEPTINQDVLLQALNEAIKVLPVAEQHYQLRLHPDDVAQLTEHFGTEYIEQHHWHIIEAPEISRGGVDVVTNSNAVDLSIERRCRDILDKFLLDNGLGGE